MYPTSTISFELDQIVQVADKLVHDYLEDKIWVFEGEMGAGKTTLIKAISQILEVSSPVSSPSFSLVNEYDTENGQIIYHFDFYRITDPEEALDIGIEEYFYSGNICLIEWAGKIGPYLPTNFLQITLEMKGPTSRSLSIIRVNDE